MDNVNNIHLLSGEQLTAARRYAVLAGWEETDGYATTVRAAYVDQLVRRTYETHARRADAFKAEYIQNTAEEAQETLAALHAR